MSEPVLSVRLTAGYGKRTVLDGVELDLQPGDSVGLAGTSGAGKSTLVLALLGLLPWRRGWARGEVLLRGRNLLSLSEAEARKVRGKEIALVPQSPLSALNPAVSLRTQLREAWKAHERSMAGFAERSRELIEQVRLPAEDTFLDRRPGEISVGQAQRVVLALALLHRPAVLIADEPTSALDPATLREVIDLLGEIQRAEGTALLYISHDVLSILQLCERIAVLEAGRIVASHPVRALNQPDLAPSLQSLLQTLPIPIAFLLTRSPISGNQ